jgi:hypothetical protein
MKDDWLVLVSLICNHNFSYLLPLHLPQRGPNTATAAQGWSEHITYIGCAVGLAVGGMHSPGSLH